MNDWDKFQGKRNEVQAELRRFTYPKSRYCHARLFKKTDKEKALLATLKAAHRKKMKQAGFSPKKRIDVSEPIRATITF